MRSPLSRPTPVMLLPVMAINNQVQPERRIFLIIWTIILIALFMFWLTVIGFIRLYFR